MFGTKKTLADVWPIKNKKFYVTADFASLNENDVPEGGSMAHAGSTIYNDEAEVPLPPPQAISSSFPTIQRIVNGHGIVILSCTFGQLAGMRLQQRHKEAILETFRAEKGLGLTLFFTSLSGKDKMHVLGQISDVQVPKKCGAAPNTGKTTFFASLSTGQKRKALTRVFPAKLYQFDVEATTELIIPVLEESIVGVTAIHFAKDPMNANSIIEQAEPGSIVVLENLRVYRNEVSERYEERLDFAKVLASYANVYVNDCFRSAHRVLSSTVELPKLMRHGAAGALMEKELLYFDRVLTHPTRPTCAIVGGNRIMDKLHLIRALIGKVDAILIAGAICLPFLAAKNVSVGKGYEAEHTLWDEGDQEEVSTTEFAARLLSEAVQSHIRIVLPVDFVAHHSFEEADNPMITTSTIVPRELFAVDVGPNTVNQFGKEIKECHTVVWAGPLGCSEIPGFDEATIELAKIMAQSNVLSIIGGKETTDAVKRAGVAVNISHLSSGSNCALEFLKGNQLPGVASLSDAGIRAALSEASASITDLLRHLPLFAGCSAQQLQIIARKAVRRNHSVGDFIIYEGDCYTSLWIVAQGELLCCPRALYGKSIAVRSLTAGQAAGQWEFISQAISSETVQVGAEDTVTYQVSAAGLQESLDESPDLAAALLSNCAEPLRTFALRQHQEASNEMYVLAEAVKSVRKPLGSNRPQNRAFQIVRGGLVAAAMHPLTTQYLHFKIQPGTCILAQLFYKGLPLKMLQTMVREWSYGNLMEWFVNNTSARHDSHGLLGPIVTAMTTAALASPLELAGRGVPFNKMKPGQLIDNAIFSATSSLAPLCSHALYLYSKSGFELSARQEDHTFEGLSRTMDYFLIMLSRVVMGFCFFPIVVRRCPEGFNIRGFLVYQLKLLLSVGLELALRKIYSRRRGGEDEQQNGGN